MEKRCGKCNELKNFDFFSKNRSKKDGRDSCCKECRNAISRAWRESNPEKYKSAQVAWEQANPGKHSEASKRWRTNNLNRYKEIKRLYRSIPENKARAAEVQRVWVDKNRELIREKEREKRRSDPQFRLRRNIRRRIKKVLDTQTKYRHCGSAVGSGWTDKGCTDTEFIQHIESLWEPWMNWTNYGNGADQWNIDHIRPLKDFDLTKRDEYRMAVHYTNIRPLHSRLNFSKGSRQETLWTTKK